MRNAQCHAITYLQGWLWIVRVAHVQVRVLVVELGDTPCCRGVAHGGGACWAPPEWDGEPHIERQVSFPCIQNGQVRLGTGLYRAPDLQRGVESTAARPRLPLQAVHGQSIVDQMTQAFVKTIVVSDVATRSEQTPHRAGQYRGQPAGHQIEHSRSTCRYPDFGCVVEQTSMVTCLGQVVHLLHQGVDQLTVCLGIALRPQAFVAFNAHQPHSRAGMCRMCEVKCLCQGSTARATCRQA